MKRLRLAEKMKALSSQSIPKRVKMMDEFPDLHAPPSSINKIAFQDPKSHVKMGCGGDRRPKVWHSTVSTKIILILHLGFAFLVCEPVPSLASE